MGPLSATTPPMRSRVAKVEYTITRADGTVEPTVHLPGTVTFPSVLDRLRVAWARFRDRISRLED